LSLEQIKFVVFDFDGVFTDNRVLVDQNGVESVICCRADGFGLDRLRELEIGMIILSTETNPVVAARASKLKLECKHGEADKLAALQKLLIERNILPESVAYLGNDINDIECMEFVGTAVAVADAFPEVKIKSDLVLETAGGHGAVREFCDRLYRERTKKCS